MNHCIKDKGKRAASLFMALVIVLSMVSASALAAQEDNYHDPAEHWLTSSNRTNELDANAVVTHETYNCKTCGASRSFVVWRTPEYTRNGQTAMIRNVRYSDGTLLDGEGTGAIVDGIPGKDSYYTGYHWTKACCETCGTMNSNLDIRDYGFNKNVYWLFDCAPEFTEKLPEQVKYEYADSTYHTKTTKGGSYCCFCFGTNHTSSSVLERHNVQTDIIPQLSNDRFAIVKHCTDCEYTSTSYVAAKSVIADYYGVVDGQPHTVTISDLSEAGVSTQIRYGNSAESCTLTSAPNYTEKGQYAVYYEIAYSYSGMTMTENGVANVWLHDEKEDTDCPCGCGVPDCDCKNPDCNGSCHKGNCGDKHNFVVLETVKPTCKTLGYTRYLCVDCGKIEKRDYVDSLDHAWQSVVVRDATCEAGGKVLKICKNCGECEETTTPKGEHKYGVSVVEPTCTSPGYTVKECEVCGDRHITDIRNAKAHNYDAIATPANCENGGYTLHLCKGCGSSFITDYTDPLGHSFDKGTVVTSPSCTGEGVTEYRCERCGYHYLEGVTTNGHTPDHEATCTEPSTCTSCGAVLKPAVGHSFKTEVTAPTCTEMGFTTYTCERCGETYKSDYVKATGHKESGWIVDKEPTTEQEGSCHKKCVNCGKVLSTESIEKLYLTATTDSKGEAIVGGYLVIVTDAKDKTPIANATVSLKKNGSISVHLPNSRLLDYSDQTTVTVKLVKDNTPVPELQIAVTDKYENYASGMTDKNGRITVPDANGRTNDEGKATVGYKAKDGERFTITVKVEDYETGRPVEGASVTIGRTGNITVVLPDGTEMGKNNRITVTVTDNRNKALGDESVIVKGDLGQKAEGKTNQDGKLTVPVVTDTERHIAYIKGFPDVSFGPERNMTRAEAATIFARILASKNGDVLYRYNDYRTKFADVPMGAWYANSVIYLTRQGIIFGLGDGAFAPDRPITRAEFTAMAVRFFDVYGDGGARLVEQYAEFTDISDGYWAAKYIRDAAVHGWVFGYGDGTFGARRPITRAEAVSIVNRLLGWEADKSYVNKNVRKLTAFSDMAKNHWAYYAVMEAANTHIATIDGSEVWSK